MKPVILKTIRWTALGLVVAGLAVLVCSNSSHRSQKTCEGLRVVYADDNRFVSEDDVKAYLDKYYGSYIGQRIDSVGLSRIEDILDAQSAVRGSEAYMTPDGMLNIKLSQRAPVLKFIKDDVGFYVDSRGYIFPLQENYSSDVPVVTGCIPVTYTPGYKGKAATEKEQTWIEGMIGMMGWISRSKLWKDGLSSIKVDQDGNLVLKPKEGRETFIFGSPDDVAGKFERIEKYNTLIKPNVEPDMYGTVNVRYKGQIICRK